MLNKKVVICIIVFSALGAKEKNVQICKDMQIGNV